jgi:imidazoleglycerol-phosphate dehydratase
MRNTEIKRYTKETQIELSLDLDGKGNSDIKTDCGFLNHMLTLFASHGMFDLNVKVKGDSEVDFHHTVEDVGIALGMAFSNALGEKKGIKRYGSFILPMDETLIMIALDISGRALLCHDLNIAPEKVGDFDTELCEEFLQAFVRNMNITLHVKQLSGTNAHHIIEGVFKCLARALKEAVEIDEKLGDKVPSTKGVL